MNWSELYEFLNQHHGADWWDDKVLVYDQKNGEFYDADLVDFPDGDDIISPGSLFVSIKSEFENE